MKGGGLSGLRIDREARQGKGGGGSRRRLLLAILALLLVVVIAFVLMGRRALEVETVTVSRSYPTQGFTLMNASGYVVAQRKAEVAATVTGRLLWLGVEEGSRVSAGQVLARLDDRDALAAQAQARARLQSARADRDQGEAELADATLAHGRQQSLLAAGIVSRAEYDAADARLKRARALVSGAASAIETARAALQGADVALDHTLIRAPFDGVVLTKNADAGDIVTPIGAASTAKASVVSMADMGSLLVEVDVAESSLSQVKVGQPCEISLDALPDIRFPGRVHMVVPTADRSKAAVQVKVRFDGLDGRVIPEMSAKVAFLSRPPAVDDLQPRLSVPQAALVSDGDRRLVYLLQGGKAVRTAVKTGRQLGSQVEILEGLAGGEKLVVSPLDRMRDGARVRTKDSLP
jgi:RND family efflux transporter MFP subunit